MAADEAAGDDKSPTKWWRARQKPLDRIELYKIYRSYIEHEDNLINQRTTWFIQLHSFLIASYGIAFAALVNSFNFDDVEPLQLFLVRIAVLFLLLGLTIVGLASANAASKSILAATGAITQLRDRGNAILVGDNENSELPGLTRGGLDVLQRDENSRKDMGVELGLRLPASLKWTWMLSFALLAWMGWVCWSARQTPSQPKPSEVLVTVPRAVELSGALNVTAPPSAASTRTESAVRPPAAPAAPVDVSDRRPNP
jgi:hypothetical protein